MAGNWFYQILWANAPEALDFPGAVTQGFDLADARLMIASALEDLDQLLLEEGKPLPLIAARFELLRSKGSHRIYGKSNLRGTFPFHSGSRSALENH